MVVRQRPSTSYSSLTTEYSSKRLAVGRGEGGKKERGGEGGEGRGRRRRRIGRGREEEKEREEFESEELISPCGLLRHHNTILVALKGTRGRPGGRNKEICSRAEGRLKLRLKRERKTAVFPAKS